MMDRDVLVRDVGPRDGLQLVKTVLPTKVKLAWIRADVAAGVPEIEVCSFVPAKVIPQFADAREVATEAARIAGYVPSALVPNLRGAELAFATGVPKVNYVLSISETHNMANVRRTRAESVDGLRRIIALRDESFPGVRVGVGLATALGCALQGTVPEAETLKVLEQVLDAGVDEVALPDTVGYAHPSQVRALFGEAIRICDDVPVWSHFHDTRGLGIANALAALEAEGLQTGVDIEALAEARVIVEAALPGERLHGLVLKAGLPKGFVPASPAAPE